MADARYHVRQYAGPMQEGAFRFGDRYAIAVSQHRSERAARKAIANMLEGDRVEAFVWDAQLGQAVST